MYQELSKFGAISEMNVCDNLGDHLIGNVYVKVMSSAVVITALLLSSQRLLFSLTFEEVSQGHSRMMRRLKDTQGW